MTLLAPAFFLGLLAIGIPVLLHRLSSENPNRQPFSSVMFLEPGEPRRVLAKKLQYLLLFALRVGVLALLVLVFVGLMLEGQLQNIMTETSRLHVIVMDRSASMSLGDRWARAQLTANNLIDEVGATDAIEVVAAGRVIEVLAEPSLDRAPIRQAIEAIQPGPFRIDYGQLMSSMEAVLRGAELPVVLHIITDAQQSSLPTRFADLSPRIPLELEVHNISVSGEENWALDGLTWMPMSGDFTASLHGYSEQEVQRTVTLRLNGAKVAEQDVLISANRAAQVSFAGVELSAGVNQVVAELIPNDNLSVDDERFLVVKRPTPQPILLITTNNRDDSSIFLTSALGILADQAYTVEQILPTELTIYSPEDFAFVVVSDGGSLADSDSSILRNYVESGGTVFMGLSQRSTGLNTVPITGHSINSFSQLGNTQDEFLTIGNVDSSHTLSNQFQGLRSVRFYRHTAVETEPNDTILISLEDGSPLLVEHVQGEGRVMIFTSSLDRQWNDLPLQPAFVPFIAELSLYMTNDFLLSTSAGLGSTLSAQAMGLSGGQIFSPNGEKALGLAGSGLGSDTVVDQIGFYEILAEGQVQAVAVNLDSQESDITSMPANGLERWNNLGSQSSQEISGNMQIVNNASIDLWPWVLFMLLIVVFVESWVGNWHLRVRRGMKA